MSDSGRWPRPEVHTSTEFEKCPRHPAPALCTGAETLRFAQGPPLGGGAHAPGASPQAASPLGPPRGPGRAVRGHYGLALSDSFNDREGSSKSVHDTPSFVLPRAGRTHLSVGGE